MKLKNRLIQHIRANYWQYLLITLIFIIGTIIGNYKIIDLEGGVKSHLLNLIDNYLQGEASKPESSAVLLASFVNQAKSLLAVWFLGLTVIGIPLILVLVSLRGFALGFTIGFLVQEKASTGLLITILSIVPQNMVFVPILIIWSVIGLNFSGLVARGKAGNSASLGSSLLNYTILLFLFLSFAFMGAFIEAYLSPWFLSLFV